jgi:hypothetical protein
MAPHALHSPVGDDLLLGANAIAEFLGIEPKQVYYFASRRLIPAGKLGGILTASKQKLREHFDKITSGE